MPAHVQAQQAKWEDVRAAVPHVDRVRQLVCKRLACSHDPLDMLACARLAWFMGFLRTIGWAVRFLDEARQTRHLVKQAPRGSGEVPRLRHSYTVEPPRPPRDAPALAEPAWHKALPVDLVVAEHWCKPLGHDHPERDARICVMVVQAAWVLLDAGLDVEPPVGGVSPWT